MQRSVHEHDKMKVLFEMKLFEHLRITDTVEQHDTLTVAQSFVQDPQLFYKIGLELMGSNFLKIPYDTTWEDDCLHTVYPPYFNPKRLFPLAYLILFVFERALWFQHEAHCRQPMRNEKAKIDNEL